MGSITMMESQIVEMRMKTERPDVIVKPQVEDIGTYDFHRYLEGVERGLAAAEQIMPKIEKYVSIKKALPETGAVAGRPDGALT